MQSTISTNYVVFNYQYTFENDVGKDWTNSLYLVQQRLFLTVLQSRVWRTTGKLEWSTSVGGYCSSVDEYSNVYSPGQGRLAAASISHGRSDMVSAFSVGPPTKHANENDPSDKEFLKCWALFLLIICRVFVIKEAHFMSSILRPFEALKYLVSWHRLRNRD